MLTHSYMLGFRLSSDAYIFEAGEPLSATVLDSHVEALCVRHAQLQPNFLETLLRSALCRFVGNLKRKL